jgi:hypothetical protein
MELSIIVYRKSLMLDLGPIWEMLPVLPMANEAVSQGRMVGDELCLLTALKRNM